MNPTQRDMNLARSISVEAVAKFAKVKVCSVDPSSSLQFNVEVAATLKESLANLPAIEPSKPKVVVIFLYDTQEESLYFRPSDVISLNACILREEDSQEKDIYNPPNPSS